MYIFYKNIIHTTFNVLVPRYTYMYTMYTTHSNLLIP